MKFATAGYLSAVFFFLLAPPASQAVSINERAGNHFRTASNNQEFILNKSNVNNAQFGLLNTFNFDAKVETQPLVLEKGINGNDLVIVTTMKNKVIGINAKTNNKVYEKELGPPINTITRKDGKETQDMDMWGHTPDWGISATPIIDPSTNTLFVAAWVQKNKGDDRYRDYKVFILDAKTGDKKAEPVRIFGQSQEGNDCWFNDANAVDGQGKQYTYPKLRAGLALTGNKGLVLAFAANGEHPNDDKRDNPHGFVIAYDTRALLNQQGFSRDPAIFCTTAFNSWGGGIWQAGGAPVTEGDMIYVATSNGTSNNGGDDLTESMIKLRYLPSLSGKRPELQKTDWYKAFLDERTSGAGCLWQDNSSEVSCGRAVPPPPGPDGEFRLRAGTDWDFGSAGPLLIPGSDVLLQGTKDGIIYALDKTDLGHNDRFNKLMFRPPLIASYFSGDKVGETQQSWLRANELNRSIPCVVDDDWFTPCKIEGGPENGRTHHIHALALTQKDAGGGIVYVWGENASLKAYDFSTTRDRRPVFRAEGEELASARIGAPGGMPGGLLMVSGKPSKLQGAPDTAIDFDTALVWAVYAKCGDANKGFAEGELIAYDATSILPGSRNMKRLFSTGNVGGCHGGLGMMSRMIPPVVANGKVYVMIYRVEGYDKVIGSQLKVFGLK